MIYKDHEKEIEKIIAMQQKLYAGINKTKQRWIETYTPKEEKHETRK